MLTFISETVIFPIVNYKHALSYKTWSEMWGLTSMSISLTFESYLKQNFKTLHRYNKQIANHFTNIY